MDCYKKVIRWLPVTSVFVRMFFFGGVMKANGVTLSYTVSRFNSTNTAVSWVFTLQCAVAFLTSKYIDG